MALVMLTMLQKYCNYNHPYCAYAPHHEYGLVVSFIVRPVDVLIVAWEDCPR